MAEQGLKAVVYPELDEAGMDEFVKSLSEHLGNTVMNVNPSVSGNADSSATNINQSTVTNNTQSAGSTVKDIAEGVQKGTEEASKTESNDDDGNEKKNKSLLKSLGGIVGGVGTVATSLVSGGTSVANTMANVFKFLENSSPPLRAVMDLFGQAFNLIWMPVGTLIAKQMMPLLVSTMTKVAQWVSRAFTAFEEGGWIGLIKEALVMSFDVLCDMIGALFPILWEGILVPLGNVIWEVMESNPVTQPFVRFFGFIWDNKDVLWEWIQKIADAIGWIWNAVDKFFGSKVEAIQNFVEDPVGSLESGAKTVWNSTVGLIPGLKWNAEGGIAVGPTITGVGEAGPEAIVPLNQISRVAQEYNNTVGNTYNGGGNVMNFYISGSNATEVGDEVQRILEKTVGKASSKMLWW